MLRKELGLFLLILVIGAITARDQSAVPLARSNLINLANQIGLFGLLAIGLGLVIITGGIELSVGSMLALLGVIFLDLLVNYELPWPVALAIVVLGGTALGAIHGLLITRLQPAALRRHAVRPAALPRHRALVHERFHRRLRLRRRLRDAGMADLGAHLEHPAHLHLLRARGARHGGPAAQVGARPLPLRRRQERGGRPLLRHSDQARSSPRPTRSAAC